jgi:2-haloacid dehalogenase
MATTHIDAWVFDAYGTLFDVHSVTETTERLFPGQGAALSQRWRAKQLDYTWQRSLMERYVDFNRVTTDALAFACEALQLPLSTQAAEAMLNAYRYLKPFADAVDALNAQRGKARLAILSNGTPDMLHAVVAHNALEGLFDAVLSVDALRVYKPDPRVYQMAVERLGIPRERVGFVSSNGWDAAGAKAFGFNVVWVNRTAAPLERLGVEPDAVITELRLLPHWAG